jgi:hypothetical protein
MAVAGAPRRVSGGGSRAEEEAEEEELSRNSATKGCHKRLSQKAVTKHITTGSISSLGSSIQHPAFGVEATGFK